MLCGMVRISRLNFAIIVLVACTEAQCSNTHCTIKFQEITYALHCTSPSALHVALRPLLAHLLLMSLDAGHSAAVPSAPGQGHAGGFGGLFGEFLGGVHRDLMSRPQGMFGAIQQQQQQQHGGGGSSYVFQSSSVTYSGIGGQTYYSSSSSRQAAGNGVSNRWRVRGILGDMLFSFSAACYHCFRRPCTVS